MTILKRDEIRLDDMQPMSESLSQLTLRKVFHSAGSDEPTLELSPHYSGCDLAEGQRCDIAPRTPDERDHFFDLTHASRLAELARQTAEAGERLIAELGSLAEAVLHKALGQLDAKSALLGALEATVREHHLAVPVVVEVGQTDAQVLESILAGEKANGQTTRFTIQINSMLKQGEAIIISLLGRIHCGPAHRIAETSRAIGCTSMLNKNHE